MPYQIALTIVAEVAAGQLDSLSRLLARMSPDPAGNDVLAFGRFEQVHFARLVILDESTDLDGQRIPAYLVFLSDIDDPQDAYLAQLVDLASAGIDLIWSHCDGYPPPEVRTRASRLAYLRARLAQADAVYINTIGRSARQIRREGLLRESIEDYLDSSWRMLSTKTAEEIRDAIREFVQRNSSLRWALQPAEPPPLSWRVEEVAHAIGTVLLLVFLLPFATFFLPFWLVLLRLHERSDQPSQAKPDPARVQGLAAVEDHLAQNQFSAIGYFKPGWFRRITAIVALWLVNAAARHIFNNGQLTGVNTIHFARWIPFDGRRRLMFASNYDGSLESYMDDFIDKVAWGLNAVFSNGVGYPRTNWLILDGAKDELAFKNFLRLRQIPTQVWYSAYGRLTALNIANNASIRAGLSGQMSSADAEAWLAHL